MSNQVTYKYIVSIKFKNNKKAYTFGTDSEDIEYGDKVIVETSQGLELGECISPLRDSSIYTGSNELKPILRKADSRDIEDYNNNLELAKKAMEFCMKKVKQLNLDMQLVSTEYSLDKSKILIVYIADERVDFRELLKVLAAELKCRIELKQIGARDKAKLIGGIGICGRECCCSKFMSGFDVISINMAKNQMLALNIPKLSGQCGKLMCCLKFEDDGYKEMVAGLPRVGSKVEYKGKLYNVLSLNPIKKEVKIQSYDEVLVTSTDELLDKAIIFKPMLIKKKVNEESKVNEETV